MSRLRDALAPSLPAGLVVPDELERAWLWMEEQGWETVNDHGSFLTPYGGERQLGVVFSTTAADGFENWFPEDFPTERLAVIAEIGGDGSSGALWLDDEGRTRFVGLGSEGDAFLLADTAVDFLRLIAIGYLELNLFEVGLAPDDEEAVAALAPFRAWVEQTFDVEVPALWPGLGEDEFTTWVERQQGIEPAVPTAADPAAGPTCPAGDLASLVAILGGPDGPEAVQAVASVTGSTPPAGTADLHGAVSWLNTLSLEVSVKRGVIATMWIKLEEGHYPHPEKLVEGLDLASNRADVLRAFGEPEREGPAWVRFFVGGRFVNVTVDDDGITRMTLMVDAP